jgi:P27 family predicted phage terminase small subunit
MPKHLDPRARKEWHRLCPMLERLRVLTEADGRALANLCYDVSVLEQAQEALSKTGLLAKSNRGLVHQSPILGIIATTTDRVTKGLREFGLTPASRSRIQTAGDGGADDLAALLATPRVRRAGAVPPVVN